MRKNKDLKYVEVHNLDTEAVYVTTTLEFCKDETDRSAFEQAVKTGQTVTIDQVIAVPVYETKKRSMEKQVRDGLEVLSKMSEKDGKDVLAYFIANLVSELEQGFGLVDTPFQDLNLPLFDIVQAVLKDYNGSCYFCNTHDESEITENTKLCILCKEKIQKYLRHQQTSTLLKNHALAYCYGTA